MNNTLCPARRILNSIILIVLAIIAGTCCIPATITNYGKVSATHVWGVEGDWKDIMGDSVDDTAVLVGDGEIEGIVHADTDYMSEIYEYVGTAPTHSAIIVSTSSDGKKVTLRVGGKSRVFRTDKTVAAKHKVFTHEYAKSKYCRNGTLNEKRAVLKLIKSQGFAAEDGLIFMFGQFSYEIDKWLVLNGDKAPIDARIAFCPDNEVKFRIIAGRDGFYLDRDSVFGAVMDSYLAGGEVAVNVVRHRVKPTVTSAELRAQTHYRAGFSTSYAGSSDARKHNVRLGLQRYNGYVLGAGKSVSFNRLVGARTAANGFLEGKIILNGRFEDGLGGGVCQSSTTMYNAALLSGMTILQARQHSLRVGYVEPSFDAMVNAGSSDLVFRNDTERPVYIRTYSNNDRVWAEFYGLKMPYVIRRRSETTKRVPCNETEVIYDHKGEYREFVKYKGERHHINYPKDGLDSKGYLRYYKDGQLIKEEHIRTDSYRALKGRIVEGVLDKPADVVEDGEEAGLVG